MFFLINKEEVDHMPKNKWNFNDFWKKNKIVIHVTKNFFIIIIEMKSQQSFH